MDKKCIFWFDPPLYLNGPIRSSYIHVIFMPVSKWIFGQLFLFSFVFFTNSTVDVFSELIFATWTYLTCLSFPKHCLQHQSCVPWAGWIILGITVTPRTQRKLVSWVEVRRKLQSSEQHFDNVSCISCVQRSSCVTSLDLQEEKNKLFTLIFLHFVC